MVINKLLLRLCVALLCLFIAGCRSTENILVLDYMNTSSGIGSTGDDLVIIADGKEETVISNALISVFQEREVSFTDIEPTLTLKPKKEYTTDHMHLSNEDVTAYNNAVSSANDLRIGPNYRIFFKVYYVIDETELRFRIRTFLEVKGLGQGEFKKYNGPYSSKYFFQLLSSSLNTKLKRK